MTEVETSKVKKHTLEERTVFELYHTKKCKEPFLQIEYPGIIELKKGDRVNIYAEDDSRESRSLSQDGVPCSLNTVFFPTRVYIVKSSNSSRMVDLSLHIGGKTNPLRKCYSLVRDKKGGHYGMSRP